MSILRFCYVLVGSLALAMGLIGVFVPILPTTPFLLLTAYCYARGSNKFYDWFTSSRLYKKHLESFVKSRSMTRKTKWSILLTADVLLLFPLIILNNVYIRVAILLLVAYKYYYFFAHIKTIEEQKTSD